MISIDFETRSEADLKKTGSWVYSLHPTTEVLCLAVKFRDNPVRLILPDEIERNGFCLIQAAIQQGEQVEAHNAFFEKAIWQNIMVKRYGWPEIKPEQWRCSASKAAYHALPRSLGGAGQTLGLDVTKDDEGRRVMLQLCKPRTKGTKIYFEKEDHPDKFKTLYDYCKSDVESEHALSKRLGDLPAKELAVWQLDQKINMRGVPIDIDAVDAALKILSEYTTKLAAEIDIITEGAIQTIGQRAKIIEWSASRGEILTGLTKDDVAKALPNIKDAKVKRLLEIRQGLSKTSTAKYEAMKNSTAPDGRIRDVLMYHGASTGRWTGKLVQFQNLPRGNIKDMATAIDLIKQGSLSAVEMLTDDVMGFMSGAIRGMVKAPEGKQFLVADFAAIEARVLGWLAGSEKMLNQFRQGQDLYKDMASNIYRVDVKDVTPEQRQLGKAAILGAGYGMGAPKFFETCLSWGIKVHEGLAKTAINTYRSTYHDVRSLWQDQEKAAHTAVRTGKKITAGKTAWFVEDDFLKCQLPSGRCLHYYKPELREKETDWGMSIELSYMAEKNGKAFRNGTYGGKLVENITQAVARDLMAEAMIRIEDEGFEIVLSVHDELIVEVPLQTALQNPLERFCNLMAATPDWATDCPVEAEGWSGINYKK
jgi:DNA polymerase bacteriophage-type